MNSFDYLTQRQQDLREQKRFRNLTARKFDGVHVIDPDGRRLLNFGANDYLGLGMEMRGHQMPHEQPPMDDADLDLRVTRWQWGQCASVGLDDLPRTIEFEDCRA